MISFSVFLEYRSLKDIGQLSRGHPLLDWRTQSLSLLDFSSWAIFTNCYLKIIRARGLHQSALALSCEHELGCPHRGSLLSSQYRWSQVCTLISLVLWSAFCSQDYFSLSSEVRIFRNLRALCCQTLENVTGKGPPSTFSHGTDVKWICRSVKASKAPGLGILLCFIVGGHLQVRGTRGTWLS